MDFAAQLANLERTAKRAATTTATAGGRGDSDPRRRRRPDNDAHNHHRNPRPRLQGSPEQSRQSELAPMLHFGYRVQPFRPPPPPPTLTMKNTSTTSTTKRHIALLMIIIDEAPYENIWKTWSTTGDAHVSLLVHAKFPDRLQSNDLKRRHLLQPPRPGRGDSYAHPEYLTHAPEWGSVQLTRAMTELLKEAMTIGRNDKGATVNDPRFSPSRYLLNDTCASTTDSQPPPLLPPVDHFVFVSESCVPVRTLKECLDLIYYSNNNSNSISSSNNEQTIGVVNETKVDAAADTTTMPTAAEAEASLQISSASTLKSKRHTPFVSWVNWCNRNSPGTPKNMYERDQFNNMHRMIPQRYRFKSDQWILLSRPHAAAVLDIDRHMRPSDQLWNSFCKMNASDEMYFATALAVLGVLKESDNSQSQISKRQVTYVDWTQGQRNPASYANGARDLRVIAKLARENGSLFARKFVPFALGHEESMTGLIDSDDWKREMEALAADDAAKP
jgi:hypothetical protein